MYRGFDETQPPIPTSVPPPPPHPRAMTSPSRARPSATGEPPTGRGPYGRSGRRMVGRRRQHAGVACVNLYEADAALGLVRLAALEDGRRWRSSSTPTRGVSGAPTAPLRTRGPTSATSGGLGGIVASPAGRRPTSSKCRRSPGRAVIAPGYGPGSSTVGASARTPACSRRGRRVPSSTSSPEHGGSRPGRHTSPTPAPTGRRARTVRPTASVGRRDDGGSAATSLQRHGCSERPASASATASRTGRVGQIAAQRGGTRSRRGRASTLLPFPRHDARRGAGGGHHPATVEP